MVIFAQTPTDYSSNNRVLFIISVFAHGMHDVSDAPLRIIRMLGTLDLPSVFVVNHDTPRYFSLFLRDVVRRLVADARRVYC